MPSHQLYDNGSVLMLYSINTQESGQLTCTAHNEFGEDHVFVSVIVRTRKCFYIFERLKLSLHLIKCFYPKLSSKIHEHKTLTLKGHIEAENNAYFLYLYITK